MSQSGIEQGKDVIVLTGPSARILGALLVVFVALPMLFLTTCLVIVRDVRTMWRARRA